MADARLAQIHAAFLFRLIPGEPPMKGHLEG